MMRQISIADAIGKRLTGFETWLRELAVLTFDDGTFAVLEAHQEYESAEISAVVPGSPRFRLLDISHEVLIRMGVISPEELNEIRAADARAREARIEAAERAQYERLRAKFDPSPAATSPPDSAPGPGCR